MTKPAKNLQLDDDALGVLMKTLRVLKKKDFFNEIIT
jgi:hypothetical protein